MPGDGPFRARNLIDYSAAFCEGSGVRHARMRNLCYEGVLHGCRGRDFFASEMLCNPANKGHLTAECVIFALARTRVVS